MAFTQTDIDTLKAAIATGAKFVKYADKEVSYNTIGDMTRALVLMQTEVSGTNRKTRTHGIYFKNGGFCGE